MQLHLAKPRVLTTSTYKYSFKPTLFITQNQCYSTYIKDTDYMYVSKPSTDFKS